MTPLTPRAEAISAARDILPLAFGVAVYGAAFGLLAAQAAMTELEVGVMGALVFAGSSQIVAVERMIAGAGAAAAIVAGVALNLRLLLITASVRDIYRDRPWWQIALGAHLATDENWALMLAKRGEGAQAGYWYLVGGGLLIGVTWLVATTAGVAFARMIPEPRAIGMDFAFTAAFIAILRSLFRGRADVVPWAVAIGVVALGQGTGLIPPAWTLIAGGLAGTVVAGLTADD
ncbi:MAG: AzlC family ABC transporter permease [Pseudomonadota bacterium]